MPPPASPLESFAPAILARDFVRLAGLFDPNVELQALTPGGFRQATGAEATVNWYVEWFSRGLDQEILVNDVFTVGVHSGLRFRLRRRLGSTPETASWYVIEQHAFMDVGPLGIERIAMVCSGHTPEPMAAPPGTVHEFDAGDLGCSDGFPPRLPSAGVRRSSSE